MPGSEYVIKYISDLSEATQGARRLERINADISQTISSNFTQATRVIGTSLNKVSETPIKLKGGEEAIKTVSNLGTVIQTSDGSFKEFNKTQTYINGQLVKTSGSLKDVTGQFARTSVETAKASKNTLTMAENMGRLAKRAILTIPVWLALRGAIMGTFKVLRDGLKTIEEQDKAWQKAKRTLQGSTDDIAKNFKRLKEITTKLSIDTGESVEKITKAFYKFSTVGFDFETSMKGAEYAVKTAVVLFGDAEETANAFARAMRVLVDRSKDAKPAGDQIAEAMALTAELWKSNAFELNEFTQSLEKFAGTAKATNFTTQQTIALLASLSTAGLRGGRAGTLLRSSIVKLLTNLDKMAQTLGIRVNPQLDSTFSVLMRVLDAIQGLDEGSKVAEQTADAIGKIFGGVRGMEAVLALKALRKEMLKNIDTVGGVDVLNKSYEDVTQTITRQLTILHNLNRETGKAFVGGLVGGEDWLTTLKDINEIIKQMIPLAKDAGGVLRDLAILGTTASIGLIYFKRQEQVKKASNVASQIKTDITKALRGELTDVELGDLIFKLSDIKIQKIVGKDLSFERTIDLIRKQAIKQIEDNFEGSPAQLKLQIESESYKPIINKEEVVRAEEIKAFLETQSNLRSELNTLGLSELQIEQSLLDYGQKINAFNEKEILDKQRLIQSLKRIQDIEYQQSISKLSIKNDLERLKLAGMLNSELLVREQIYNNELGIQERYQDYLQRRSDYEKALRDEAREMVRIYIDFELDLLKLQGATNQQLVLARQELESSFNINQDRLSQLKNELDLEKSITEEKLNQNTLSSDTLQLFKISQKYGLQATEAIAEFLKGERDLRTSVFTPSGRVDLSTILEEFFSSRLLQAQAKEFFTEGRGTRIPIPEREAIRTLRPELSPERLELLKAQLPKIQFPDIQTSIGQIQVEIKQDISDALSFQDLGERIQNELADAIRIDPKIKEAIDERIENF